MANLIEELEKLGALRDRGVLTQEEFDRQKAVLLASPGGAAASPAPAAPFAPSNAVPPAGSFHGGQPVASAPASATIPDFPDFPPSPAEVPPGMPQYPQPSGGTNNGLIFALVGGGIALVLLICVGLWAAGLFKRHSSYTPPAYSSYTPPVATPTSSVSSTVGDGGDNPLLGLWYADVGQPATCPNAITYKETTAVLVALDGTTTVVPMEYSVYSNEQVVMIAPDRPTARTTVTITAGRYMSLSDSSCKYHRS